MFASEVMARHVARLRVGRISSISVNAPTSPAKKAAPIRKKIAMNSTLVPANTAHVETTM